MNTSEGPAGKTDGRPCTAGALRIVGYSRVSTEEQGERGHSLGAQEGHLRTYSRAHDLVALEQDKKTGKTLDRPGLQRALARLDAGEANALLVMKTDRLTRSVRDLEDLLERYFTTRFRLLSVQESVDTQSAKGRLVLRILTAVSQCEVEENAERTRTALTHLREKGGGTPRLEGRAVERILELDGAKRSLRQIARILTEEGVPTLRGGKWAANTVDKVLKRMRGGAAE